MFPFRRILVALAGTTTDHGLVEYACMLASASSGAEVRCVHVAASNESLQRALPQLECAASRLKGASPLFVVGAREDRLLELAAEHRTELILVGGGRSLALRLAMKAPCSVWMVPKGSPARVKRILVPTDFSERSADAVSVATALAESLCIDEAHALHVYFNEALATYDEYEELLTEQHEDAFHLFVAPIDLHGVELKPLFVEGPVVAQTIVRVAAENAFDLIVMGTRGRSRSAAVLLGSEAEHTLRETLVPALVVKHFGARLRVLEALLDQRLRKRGSERFS